MRALLVTGIVATSLMLALPACGTGEDESGVTAALQQVRRAWLAEDYGGVCALLTDNARRELGRVGHGVAGDCRRDVATRISAAVLSPRDLAEPRVEKVRVDGDKATVVAVLGGTAPAEVRFAKDDGTWKLDRVFGITAPPARLVR